MRPHARGFQDRRFQNRRAGAPRSACLSRETHAGSRCLASATSLVAVRAGDNERPPSQSRCHRAVLLGVLATAIFAPSWAVAEAPAAADAFWRRTASTTSFSWQDRGLREGLQQLAHAHQIQVWIDRRVDPARRVTVEVTGVPLLEAIREIAQRAGAAAVAIEPVIIVGHPETVLRIAASIGRLRGELAATTHPAARRLRERQAVQWPMLATPDDALAAAFRAWRIDPPPVTLPHDLWPAGELREVDAAMALGLIAGGFDRAVRFDAPAVAFEPLASSPTYTANYRAAEVPRPLRNEVAERDSATMWNVRGPTVELTATAVGHAALRMALAAAETRDAPAGRNAAPAESRFTLEVKQTPAAELLAKLAAAGGWQLEISEEAQRRAASRISLSARDATLAELVEAACRQAGLEGQLEGGRLRVRPATRPHPAAPNGPSPSSAP